MAAMRKGHQAGLVNYTFREMERIVIANGYSYARTNGDHRIYRKQGAEKTIVLARKKHINPCIARRIIKENNLAC